MKDHDTLFQGFETARASLAYILDSFFLEIYMLR